MSGFGKNVTPRRAHKERAQPGARVARHGLLEKKGDWKLRARNQNCKELRIKLLREKAAFRNPDEFYYGMIGTSTSRGVVNRARDIKEALPIARRDLEQRLLAETQDRGYVGVRAGLEGGKVEKLRNGLHFVSAAGAAPALRKHVLFVDDEDQLEKFDIRVHREEAWESTRCAGSYDNGGPLREEDGGEMQRSSHRYVKKKLKKERARAYRELEQRVDRQDKLKSVIHDMELETKLLGKGHRRKVRDADPETGAPAVFKWRKERRR